MNTHFSDVIDQQTEATFVEPINVDEERQLIAMTREGLISVINTVIQSCADHVTDAKERYVILSMRS